MIVDGCGAYRIESDTHAHIYMLMHLHKDFVMIKFLFYEMLPILFSTCKRATRAQTRAKHEHKRLSKDRNLPLGRHKIQPVRDLTWHQESTQVGSQNENDDDSVPEALSTTINNILLQQRSGSEQLLPGTFVMCVGDGEVTGSHIICFHG